MSQHLIFILLSVSFFTQLWDVFALHYTHHRTVQPHQRGILTHQRQSMPHHSIFLPHERGYSSHLRQVVHRRASRRGGSRSLAQLTADIEKIKVNVAAQDEFLYGRKYAIIGFGHGLTEGGQPSGEFYGYMELPRCLEACYTKRTNGDHDVNGVVYFPTNQQCNCERNTRAHANDAASLHYTLHDVPGGGAKNVDNINVFDNNNNNNNNNNNDQKNTNNNMNHNFQNSNEDNNTTMNNFFTSSTTNMQNGNTNNNNNECCATNNMNGISDYQNWSQDNWNKQHVRIGNSIVDAMTTVSAARDEILEASSAEKKKKKKKRKNRNMKRKRLRVYKKKHF